jgi:hypothetical protein
MPESDPKPGDHTGTDTQSEFIYDPNDPWLIEAGKYWSKMTMEQLIADFMKNEGSQTEEWPDFGAR